MKQRDFASNYLREAELRVDTARRALRQKAYPYCVRQSQEAAEMSLKAALLLIGIDYPKWHDVGEVLVRESLRLPPWFQKEIPAIANISQFLAAQREISMYGDDIHKKGPHK